MIYEKVKIMLDLKEKTKEYLEKAGAGLARGISGYSGIVNKSKEGKILIFGHDSNANSNPRIWNYDSIESMLADGWELS